MDSIRHRITGFIKKHSAMAVCAALVASAVLAGTIQMNISDASATGSVGKSGHSSKPHYGGDGGVDVYAQGPEVGITPKVYSYASMVNKPGKGNSSQKSRDIYTYNEKKADVADRRKNMKKKMAEYKKKHEKKKGTSYEAHFTSRLCGYGWNVHTSPTNTNGYVITMADRQRREMTAAAISNMAEQYSNGTIVFVPKTTVPSERTYGDVHAYENVIEGNDISDDTDTKNHHSATHIFFDYKDSGLGSFFDKVTVKGSSGSQRTYNRSLINQQIIAKGANGIYRGYIRDMEKENEQENEKKNNNCWSTYYGKDGKQHYYQNQASDMNYIDKHLDRLLGKVRNSSTDQWHRALYLYALAANVYEKDNLYTQPRTLQDYLDIVTYKSLKGYGAKASDLKKIRSGKTMHVLKYPYPSKNSTEASIYDHFMKAKTFADLDIATKLVNGKDTSYASQSDSLVASYVQSEYNMAYLDMLLCGYSIAYHMQGNNASSNAAKAWENAISTYVKSATGAGGANLSIVSVKFDIGAFCKAKGMKFYHTSHGTMAKSVLRTGNGVGFNTPNKDANSRTIMKSFIGIQTKSHAKKYLIYNSNDYIRSFKGANDAGNYYSRLKKASEHNNKKVVTNFDHYIKGAANRMFDFSQIDKSVSDSNKAGQAGSEDWVQLLNNGLTEMSRSDTGIKVSPYNYGTFATVSLSWWNPVEAMEKGKTNPHEDPHVGSSKYELRLYSTVAHATHEGAKNIEKKKKGNTFEYSIDDDDGKIATYNGSKIHNTAELAQLNVSSPGKYQIADDIYLKVDNRNRNNYFKELIEHKHDGFALGYWYGNPKFKVYYFASKDGDGTDGTDATNVQKQAAKKPTVLKNGKKKEFKQDKFQDKKATKWYSTDKNKYAFKSVDIDMKSKKATGVDTKMNIEQNGKKLTNVNNGDYQKFYIYADKKHKGAVPLKGSVDNSNDKKSQKGSSKKKGRASKIKKSSAKKEKTGVEMITDNSAYYGTNKRWDDSCNKVTTIRPAKTRTGGRSLKKSRKTLAKYNYKNLTWQIPFNEMKSSYTSSKGKPGGITITVPPDKDIKAGKYGNKKTWTKYYRVCVMAKVVVLDENDRYYFKDETRNTKDGNDEIISVKGSKEKSTFYTNPVYITYKVTYTPHETSKPETPEFKFYGNYSEIDTSQSASENAYSEFKEGSVYNETFEAMAGVPSTRTMYFATGGEEFMVNLQAVYDDYVAKKNGTNTIGKLGQNVDPNAYRAVRKYTVHFNGVDCEYKEGDTFKGLSSGDRSEETFAADKNDNRDGKPAIREVNRAPKPDGASGGNTDAHTNGHTSETNYAVSWSGTISNQTSRPSNNFGSFNPGKAGSPCAGNGYDEGNGDSRFMSNASTNWNVDDYNKALENATDWAKKMEELSGQKEGNTWRWDDSDGIERHYHVGKAKIKITLTGGSKHYSENCGADPNLGAKAGSYTTGNALTAKLSSGEKAVLGSGWSWKKGHNGKGGGYAAGCGHGCSTVWDVWPSKDDPGKAHTHTHKCGWFNPGENAVDGKSDDIEYTISVTWHDGKIDAEFKDGDSSNGHVSFSPKTGLTKIAPHAMCGACCQHKLPAIEDTWTQKLRYDTVRFSALQVWKLDDGYAGDINPESGADSQGQETDPPVETIGSDDSGSDKEDDYSEPDPDYGGDDDEDDYVDASEDIEFEDDSDYVPGEDSDDTDDSGSASSDDGSSGTGFGEMSILKRKTNGVGNGVESYGTGSSVDKIEDNEDIPGNRKRKETTVNGKVARPITGQEADYVRSKVVRYDPNIFYNIATSETSRAGRLRYSLQMGQDDEVYYEEMGDTKRSNGKTRDNLCDGQMASNWPGKGVSPVTISGKGHELNFCKGCLYTNNSYSNDMYHHNNPKKSTKHYKGSNGWDKVIDENKSTIGPTAAVKTGYSDKTDAVDKTTTEWKRFDARRAEPCDVTVVSDFLILQTSSGDQSMYYYDETVGVDRCDENFPDDLWHSKPTDISVKNVSSALRSKEGVADNAKCRSYVENVNDAGKAWADMWDNNNNRFDVSKNKIYVGGYNGDYSDVYGKYDKESHGRVSTAFDDDYKYFTGHCKQDDIKDLNSEGLLSRDGNYCEPAEIFNSSAKTEHSRTAETVDKQREDQKNCNSDNDILYGVNDGYLSSPGYGNTYPDGKPLDTGYGQNALYGLMEGSARAPHNTYDFYKAPTKASAWGNQKYMENGQIVRWDDRIPDPAAAKFGNAGLVLLQDGISLNPTIQNSLYNTGYSYAFYKPLIRYKNKMADSSDMVNSYYMTKNNDSEIHEGVVKFNDGERVRLHEGETRGYTFPVKNSLNGYLNKWGVTYASKYCDGQTKVNNIIIQDPVSVQYARVLGANSKYDQRIYGDDKANARQVNEEDNAANEKCPGTAADCIYRVLNCKYGQYMRKAAFDIDHATRQYYDPEDDMSGTYDTIESTVKADDVYPSIDLTGSGFSLAMDDGSTFTGNETEDEDGNITSYSAKHLVGSDGASLEFGWSTFGVDTTNSGDRYQVGADFTFNHSGKQALFATEDTDVSLLEDGRIQVKDQNGTYTSRQAIGSGKHHIVYKFAFDSVLFAPVTLKNGSTEYRFEANTGVNVDGTDLTFDGPAVTWETLSIDNAGPAFYIGNSGSLGEDESPLDASYSVDNIYIDRLPGSTSHTAACFIVGEEEHDSVNQDYYNGTGNLSAGSIDWTGEYNDGTKVLTSIYNKHTHTGKCLSSVTDGLKVAIQEASAGNTKDLEKELGEKVWNKVKDKLSECYGADGSSVSVGQTTTYGYTGGTQKVTLMPGTYELEAYGAKGGNDSQQGGNGGYAKGKLKVDKATDIYIAAGGKGADAATGNGGGYNGGGNAGRSGSSGGGGGATSISLANGTLRNVMASDRTNVLLVAGGGGGGGNARTDSTTRSDSEYVVYGRERATNAVHTFTAQASGTVYFWSQNCNNDPWGTIKIYRNGQLVTTKEDDDGGRGTDPDGVPFGPNSGGNYFNFSMSTSFQQGDYVELWVGSFSPSYDNNYCTWHYKYNGTRTINGRGGTGGGVSGGDGEGMNENAYGGSSNHASYKGYGGDCRAADGGGGGGGFYGGYGAQEDAGAGGGSGYTSPRLTETAMSNGVNSGNGYAKIKVLELKTYSPTKVLNVIKSVIGGDVSQIPSYVTTAGHTIVNPIWVCEGKFDEHVCTDKCKTFANGGVEITLNCHEPHHYGEHYEEGNEICYDPCNNDAKHSAGAHKEATKNKDKDNKPSEGNNNAVDSGFIRLDNYFSVYYPCLGDFYETSDNGIEKCEQAKGIGYVNSMDCSEWTREKWIRFPYSTLYYRESLGKWEEHQADEWYQVDIGYTDAEGHFHPYNYYKFYCQLKNEELSMAKVDFMVEAINDKGPETSPYGYETPYGRDEIKAQDCPEDNQWKTNAKRFDGTDGDNAKSIMYDAYHSAYRNYYIDVVGRIGNLLFEDSTDWRFSNFFKQAETPHKWNQDGIAYEVDKAKQNMYYSWHLNNDDTAEDIRAQKVTPNIQWYNTYDTLKWTDIGTKFYKAAPTPLEAWKNYTHQDQYFQETYGKDVSKYLEQTHMQFGYDLLWDISTIGNYDDGNLQIEPKYYAFDTWKKKVIPVDVHMSDGEDTKTINYFGLMDEYGTKRYDEYSAKLYHYNMNLDWKHEQKERNATGKEWKHTLAVSKVFYNYVYRDTPDGPKLVTTGEGGNETALRVNLDIPHGEHYSLGDIQFQYLDTGRTATYFGDSTVPALNSGTVDDTDDYTSTVNSGINGGIDQELWHNYGVLGEEGGQNDVHDYQYWIKGQRWHTRLGLPSNVRFTDASDKNGDDLPDHVSPDSLTTDEHGNTIREWEKFDNDEIEKKTGRRRYIFLETATITAIGDPWNLRYDQKENNGHITVGSKYTGGETYPYYFSQTHDEKNSIWDFPTLLAVYDNDIPTDSDYDTLQTH